MEPRDSKASFGPWADTIKNVPHSTQKPGPPCYPQRDEGVPQGR